MTFDRRRFLAGVGATLATLSMSSLFKAGHSLAAAADFADPVRQLIANNHIIDALSFGHNWDEVEFAALKETGLTGIQTSLANANLDVALNDLNEWQHRIEDNPEIFILAEDSSAFLQARAENKVAVLLGFQNGTIIEKDIDNLDILYRMGTRCIQLTYNDRNLLGNGCTERVDGGLSDFGIAAVERMNDLGIIVDLSHCGRQTTFDGVEFSKKPAAYTHTMCETLYKDHPRAKTDAQLKACADKGGCIGIVGIGYFIGPDPGGETTVEHYIDHIEHAINVAGIDHIALGMDFPVRGIGTWATKETWYDPRIRFFKPSYQVRWPSWIPELDSTDRFYTTADLLLKRGHSEDDVEKVLGKNWLTYFKEVIG